MSNNQIYIDIKRAYVEDLYKMTMAGLIQRSEILYNADDKAKQLDDLSQNIGFNINRLENNKYWDDLYVLFVKIMTKNIDRDSFFKSKEEISEYDKLLDKIEQGIEKSTARTELKAQKAKSSDIKVVISSNDMWKEVLDINSIFNILEDKLKIAIEAEIQVYKEQMTLDILFNSNFKKYSDSIRKDIIDAAIERIQNLDIYALYKTENKGFKRLLQNIEAYPDEFESVHKCLKEKLRKL